MANNYIIIQMFTQGSNTYLNGTVNGIPENIAFPASELATFPNATAFENYVAPLMLAAVPATVTPNTPLATSFSQ